MAKDIRAGDGWTIVVNAQNAVEIHWTGDAPEGLVLTGNGYEIELTGEGVAVIDPGTYIAKRRVDVPTEFALHGAVPNPFNAVCAIGFDIPARTKVEIEVFDMLGRKVNTLTSAEFEAGAHRVIWDGTSDNGRDVSSGVYLYRMTAGDFEANGRMVLLR
ncbi:hypothetical protein DRQ36_01895 [bacterium]|nr:MAG: hypothetical protein DRQ36_01895 [bacterium]